MNKKYIKEKLDKYKNLYGIDILEKDVGRITFPNILPKDTRPDQEVKTLNPDKKYNKNGELISSTEYESRKTANKIKNNRYGRKAAEEATGLALRQIKTKNSAEKIHNTPEESRGGLGYVIAPGKNDDPIGSYKSPENKSERIPFVKEHEGLHHLIQKLSSQTKIPSDQIYKKMNSFISRPYESHLVRALSERRGYSPRNNIREKVTALRDALVNKEWRDEVLKNVKDKDRHKMMAYMKRDFQNIRNWAKNITNDEIRKIVNKSEYSQMQNPNISNKNVHIDGLSKGAKGDWEKEGYKLEHEFYEPIEGDADVPYGEHAISAYDKAGNEVGRARFIIDEDNNQLIPNDIYRAAVDVDSPHRRKGIATAMYNLAEQKSGMKIKPSDRQDPGGVALWNQPDRPFGKAQMMNNKLRKLHKAFHRPKEPRVGVGISSMKRRPENPNPTMQKSEDIPVISSVAVINGKYILMGRRRDNQRWTMPGGHCEAGENPKTGAVRELEEESGIKCKDVKFLANETVKGEDGKTREINAFACFGDFATNVYSDPDGEIVRWFWVDTSHGLPEKIKNNLHSPKNVTLKAVGLLDY